MKTGKHTRLLLECMLVNSRERKYVCLFFLGMSCSTYFYLNLQGMICASDCVNSPILTGPIRVR